MFESDNQALIAAGIVPGDETELLAGVDAAERAPYRQAAQLTARGDYAAAWETLEPLSARHADCYAIQHLACGLAMELGDFGSAREMCERAQKLASSQGAATQAKPGAK